MEKFRFIKRVSNLGKPRLYYSLSLFLIGSILLTYRLTDTPKGLSATELSTQNNLINHGYNYHYLLHHVSNFMFSWYLTALNYLNLHGLFLIRLSGYLCGIIAIFMFYYIAETFTNKLIGVLSTGLFSTSLWFLQITRNSQSLGYYSFTILIGVLISILYYRKKSINLLVILSSILFGFTLYIPGMFWFGLLFIIINYRTIKAEIRSLSIKYKILPLSFFIIIVAPIIYDFTLNHSQIYLSLLIPSAINFHQLLIQFLNYPKYLFFENNPTLAFSIGRLPLIVFASTILVVFSGIWLYKNRKNTITAYIYLSVAINWLLYTLNGGKSIYITLPLFSLLMSIGVYYLYTEWKKIFPRNPYSDFTARVLIVLLISSICLYQVLLYFIVWPHTTNVLSLYSHYL